MLPSGANEDLGLVVFFRRSTVSGFVDGLDASPDRALVHFQIMESGRSGSVHTDDSAHFSLSNLPEGVPVELWASTRDLREGPTVTVEPPGRGIGLMLPRAKRLKVLVEDPDGKPVTEFHWAVKANMDSPSVAAVVLAGEVKNGSGRFSLNLPEHVRELGLGLVVTGAGFLPRRVDLADVDVGQVLEVEFTRALHIHGQVTDLETGRPVDGATISISCLERKTENRTRETAKSRDDGRYRLRVPPDSSCLARAEAADHSPEGKKFQVGRAGSRKVDFTLSSEGVIEGRVVDAMGMPLDGASVTVVDPVLGEHRSQRTGSNGHFLIRKLRRDAPLGLVASKRGYLRKSLEVRAPESSESRLMMIELAKGAEWRGKVGDGRGAAPGGTITLYSNRAMRFSALIGVAGDFYLSPGPTGRVSYVVSTRGHRSLCSGSLDVPPHVHVFQPQIPCVEGFDVQGELVSSGGGVSGITLYLAPNTPDGRTASTVAGSGGRFVLHNVIPGSYNLIVLRTSAQEPASRVIWSGDLMSPRYLRVRLPRSKASNPSSPRNE